VILDGWNPEKVTALAPDHNAAKESRKLATPAVNWVEMGRDDFTVWGRYSGTDPAPYEVKIDLLKLDRGEKTAFHCTCKSHKLPCKHTIALLFIAVEHPESIPTAELPAYVSGWLDKEAVRARTQERKKKRTDRHVDEQQLEKNLAERRSRIRGGLEELERWIENMIAQGLATDPQVRTYTFWDAKAARMIDAQAPGIARWLRDMGGIAVGGGDWIEALLRELGRLYLLIEAFKRFEALPEGVQGDIRAVVGWHQKREELRGNAGVTDRWLVIGQRFDSEEEKLRSQRLWLRGESTGCDALIMEFAYGDEVFETKLSPGTAFDGELVFYPSAYPLRAFIKNQEGGSFPAGVIQGSPLETSLDSYRHAILRNPWLPQYPFLLEGMIPTRYESKWIVRDIAGFYLPVAAEFPHKWSLFALGGNRPIAIAGEWNGIEFLPTGAIVEGRFVDFNLVGKL
jgi:hypothetical protein